MVKGKIFYDNVIRSREEWEEYLMNFYNDNMSLDLIDSPHFEEIQSHYFAILHNNPLEIKSKIINQVKHKLGMHSIVEDEILGTGKNSIVYRISTPIQITIYRDKILHGDKNWKKCPELHNKKMIAISNLIEKLESGGFG